MKLPNQELAVIQALHARKDRFVATRVESDILYLLRNVAQSAGVTVSEYLRHLVITDLSRQRILEDRSMKAIVQVFSGDNGKCKIM